jgi:uncharacterized protein (DUF1697 family)
MPRYVALLRSVNVGGRVLPMAGLRTAFEKHGFEDVETYIQSGNVVFTSSSRSEAAVAKHAHTAIRSTTKLDVPVFIRSPAALRKIIAAQPFVDAAPKALHVTFLEHAPAAALVRALAARPSPPDEFAVKGREIYLCCPNGYGRSKLNNAFFERALKTAATTRNWNTVQKLLALSS